MLFLGTLSPRSNLAVQQAIHDKNYTTQMVIAKGDHFGTISVSPFQKVVTYAFEALKKNNQIEIEISPSGQGIWNMNNQKYSINTEFADAVAEAAKRIGMNVQTSKTFTTPQTCGNPDHRLTKVTLYVVPGEK